VPQHHHEPGKNPVQVAPKWKKVQLQKRLQLKYQQAAAAEAETNSAVALGIKY
jgi:hypothetical protein